MSDITTPTTDTSKKALSSLSFTERGKLFFRKYQYINGHNMDDVAAEEKAREDFGVLPMTDAEKEKAMGPGIVGKVVDNKVMQSVGASAVLHKTWDKYVEGKDAPATETVKTEEVTEPATKETLQEQATNKLHSTEQELVAKLAEKVGLEVTQKKD